MPYDRINGIKTKKGRVVYRRKPNPWRLSDLLRIGRALRANMWTFATEAFDLLLEELFTPRWEIEGVEALATPDKPVKLDVQTVAVDGKRVIIIMED